MKCLSTAVWRRSNQNWTQTDIPSAGIDLAGIENLARTPRDLAHLAGKSRRVAGRVLHSNV
ncbi:hypothetical protein BCAR13_860045 [Paraburkholderia caribensis]|nr:hypothetical protein BCAR13_860045 [Paraburkholderia caribensis]